MSWIQLHGETWPVTTDEGELRVFVLAPDVQCPRVGWTVEAAHYIKTTEPVPAGSPGLDRWLNIDLGSLILNVRDWRRLENLEIRADAAWHATQEFIGPYGHCYNAPRVNVSRTVLKRYAEKEGVEVGRKAWVAHDFVLRLGSRDGWSFPLELDAWLIPEEKYWRKKPEPRKEALQFAEGEPNFRLITRLTLDSAHAELSRDSAADPVTEARRILRERVGLDELKDPKIEWAVRSEPDGDKIVPMPGWRSSVYFLTPAG